MPQIESLEFLLSQAKEREDKHDWIGAVELYSRALKLTPMLKDSLKAAEVYERSGHCAFRGAFQAESEDQFGSRIQAAAEAFEKAAELFDKREDPAKQS